MSSSPPGVQPKGKPNAAVVFEAVKRIAGDDLTKDTKINSNEVVILLKDWGYDTDNLNRQIVYTATHKLRKVGNNSSTRSQHTSVQKRVEGFINLLTSGSKGNGKQTATQNSMAKSERQALPESQPELAAVQSDDNNATGAMSDFWEIYQIVCYYNTKLGREKFERLIHIAQQLSEANEL